MVKILPVSTGSGIDPSWGDLPEKEVAASSITLALKSPMDRGSQVGTVHGGSKE